MQSVLLHQDQSVQAPDARERPGNRKNRIIGKGIPEIQPDKRCIIHDKAIPLAIILFNLDALDTVSDTRCGEVLC